jgi:hypothetical protein
MVWSASIHNSINSGPETAAQQRSAGPRSDENRNLIGIRAESVGALTEPLGDRKVLNEHDDEVPQS